MKLKPLYFSMVLIATFSLGQVAGADQSIKFGQGMRVKDTVCCGGRMSDVSFDHIYLRSEDGLFQARATCTGTWTTKYLTILVTKGPFFNISSSKPFYFEKSSSEECRKVLASLVTISPDQPFQMDLF